MALVPCLTKHVLRENQDYVPGEREYCPQHGPLSLLCSAQSQGEGPLGLRAGLCLFPFCPGKLSTRCPHPWESWQEPGGLGKWHLGKGDSCGLLAQGPQCWRM